MYKQDQIRMWPRLLGAAVAVDQVVAGALKDIWERGGECGLTETFGIRLSPGSMQPEAYATIRQQHLAPRSGIMQTVLHRAANDAHPWIQPIGQALADLLQRCKKGDEALARANQAKKADDIKMVCATLLERNYQAKTLAEALFNSGLDAYATQASERMGRHMDLLDLARGIGVKFKVNDGVAWPVKVPGPPVQNESGKWVASDQWIWIADAEGVTPKTIIGVKEWIEGELVLSDLIISALLPLNRKTRMQEAGIA